jgi:hypothetical protein
MSLEAFCAARKMSLSVIICSGVGTRDLHTRHERAVSSATPASSIDRASAKTRCALTFHLDQSMGADQDLGEHGTVS